MVVVVDCHFSKHLVASYGCIPKRKRFLYTQRIQNLFSYMLNVFEFARLLIRDFQEVCFVLNLLIEWNIQVFFFYYRISIGSFDELTQNATPEILVILISDVPYFLIFFFCQ